MKIMMVEWDDAHSSTSWEPKESLCLIAPCVSVGIVLQSDDKQIELCQTINPDYSKLSSIAIPRGCIRRMRLLCLE